MLFLGQRSAYSPDHTAFLGVRRGTGIGGRGRARAVFAPETRVAPLGLRDLPKHLRLVPLAALSLALLGSVRHDRFTNVGNGILKYEEPGILGKSGLYIVRNAEIPHEEPQL